MDISIREMAEKFMDYDEYRIVYHIRPDGDCIGSAFAFALGLKSIGKKCDVVGRDEVPKMHRHMTDEIELDELKNPVYVAVDAASPHRVGTYSDKHFTFCIDHHANTFDDADYRYVEKDCGACSEIIFKLMKEMGIKITKQMANLLYTAIVTDTRCFSTSDTSVQTFETAIELAKLGADISNIGRRNIFMKSRQRMKIEDILCNSFHFTCNDSILTGIITLDDLKEADILDSELEGINSIIGSVEGVMIGCTIRELPDGTSRCSMRTNGNMSANEICNIHGGGGHFHAACCELPESPAEAREIIEKTCKEYLLSHK